jgi:two-component system, chemotaxis family, chemotaxis protein CheY
MKKILYVEDSVTAQKMMHTLLEGVGDITVASTLTTARAELEKGSHDLLIVDYLLPQGDALDFVRLARQNAPATVLPIVVISGSMDRLMLSDALKAGANDAFAKPLRAMEFRTAIELLLDQPYVRSITHGVTGVRCFQWTSNGTHFQFNPDLGLLTSAATKEAASAQMLAALKKRADAGVELGAATHERIVTHIIESSFAVTA